MSNTDHLASIVIRTLNEEAKLGEVLSALRAQTWQAFEVIVVDSGSTDDTLAIAEAFSARIFSLPREAFTFGYALNYGFEKARGDYLVALSGHAIPWRDDWLARLLSHLAAPEVAGSSGGSGFLPGVDYAAFRLRQIALHAGNFLTEPTWGFSNGASAIKAELWRRHPFDEKLTGCEDLEWAWFWIKRGYTILWDETCSVVHQHGETLRQQFQRSRRESAGLAAFLEVPPYGARQWLSEWLCDPVKEALMALWRGYSPARAADLWGRWTGLRQPSPADYPLEPAESVPVEECLPPRKSVSLPAAPVKGLVSVLIRTLNEEAKLGEVLAALQRQTYHEVEVLVVDSGSTDRTLQIAEEHGVTVLQIPPETFTYGHALNYACTRARGQYLVALSGHTIPWFDGWLERLVSHLTDPEVAAASGGGMVSANGYGSRRLRVVRLDAHNYLREPTWGMNNAASAFRAELWRRHPFDEQLTYCEDLEWGWFWMKRGYALIWDEACSVVHEHHETLWQQFKRSRRQGAGLAAMLAPGRPNVLRPLSEWLIDPLKAMVLAVLRGYSPGRATHLWGKYRGLNAPSAATYARELAGEVPQEECLRPEGSQRLPAAVS